MPPAVAGADVIALQEVSRYMPIAPYEDQPAQLSALLPGYFWVYGPAMDIDGSETSPDNKVRNRRVQFGNMLLAKAPVDFRGLSVAQAHADRPPKSPACRS